jgi:hypothetical protein
MAEAALGSPAEDVHPPATETEIGTRSVGHLTGPAFRDRRIAAQA